MSANNDYTLYKNSRKSAKVRVTSDLKYANKNGIRKLAKDKWSLKRENYVNCNVKKNWKEKKVYMSAPVSADINLDPADMITDIIDNHDRPGEASAKGVYTMHGTNKVKGFKDKPGERVPKLEAFAGAGIGRASAHISMCEAEANGPNAKAGAFVSPTGVSAMAGAELASASARAGPLGVKIGLGVDTGARIGVTGVEAKFLGTGFKIGPEMSVSILGSEASCCVQ